MAENLYDMIKNNQKKEYPIANQKKDFVKLLQTASQWREKNNNEVKKEAFMDMSTDGKTLSNLTLNEQIFNNCIFDGSIISHCVFENCHFLNCSFSGCTLGAVKFNECNIRNCDFTSTKMMDVNASTSIKSNCKFSEINPDNNVIGFDEKENNIISDQADETGTSSEIIVKNCMEKNFKDWKLSQNKDAYQLLFPDDENTGIALYQNPEKNSESSQIWELDLFIGNESILMHDFDLYQKTEEQVKEIIEDFVEQTLIENSQTIVKNIIALLNKEEIKNDID